MKKLLLVTISIFFALITTAADLNPFAYGLSSSYDPSTFTLTINYSLNAPATSVDLVIIDSNGAEAGRIALPGKTKGTFSSVKADLSTIGLVGGEYSWKLDVTCNARSAYYEPIGRVKKLQSPFSVDVDNNPNSQYFGQIYVSQPTTNTTRGIYVYKPGFTATIGNYMGSGISVNTSESWYSGTHAVPYRIRVVQDGTGRILVTSCDKSQSIHLWLIEDPAHMTSWTPVITSSQLKTWTGHNATNNFANTSIDIRKSDNGQNWELLLYSATVDKNSTNFSAGYVYSGIYTVPITTKDFKGGTYTNLTKATVQSGELVQDATISGKWTGSMITANAQFDKFGGVLYSSYSVGTNQTSSSLIHRTKNGTYKTDYVNEHYLYRENVATGAIRFNHDFTRLAIAQGSLEKEARFYTVTQAQASDHIALSARKACDMIPSDIDTGSEKAYVIDFAWDYASNIYAVVRNGSYAIYGVYAMAANLGGAAVSTPARAEYKFEVDCPDRTWSVNVSGQVDGKTLNTDLGECALQIDGKSAAWNTTLSVQACTKISVKVTKDDKHKFAGWYNGETLLTKEEEYSFYAVKDINLVAKFEFAEYKGIKWYNLFKNGEDICSPVLDKTKNARLWYLFMPYYNKDASAKRGIFGFNSVVISDYNVTGFCANNTDNVLNDPNRMKWLGDYFKHLIKNADWSDHIDFNRCMYAFINRVDYAYNSSTYKYKDGDGFQSSGLIAQLSVFATTGQIKAADTINWRHWWTRLACELPDTLKYNDPMPIEWNMIPGPNGTTYDNYTTQLPTDADVKLVNTPKWYKWNTNPNEDDYLLAWRSGGDGLDKKIVHQITADSMELYATYVKKILDENNSMADGTSNEDVIRLMTNTNHTTDTERFYVTRKLVGGMYNTICMPFTLKLEGLMNEHPLYGAKVWAGK